jgi:hypothetical protein
MPILWKPTSGALPVERACVFLTQAFLNLVDATCQKQDARGDAWMLVAGFFEFPRDVGEAGDGSDL